jgi:transcriptional regulator with XRE-family HTH domain
LKVLRRLRGWTQHDLSMKSGVGRSLIGTVEAGYTPATDEFKQKINAAFGLDPLGEEAEAAFRVLNGGE